MIFFHFENDENIEMQKFVRTILTESLDMW